MSNDSHPFFKQVNDDLRIDTRYLPGTNSILAQVHLGKSLIYHQNFLMPVQIESEQESDFYIAACQRLVADIVERMIDLGQISG